MIAPLRDEFCRDNGSLPDQAVNGRDPNGGHGGHGGPGGRSPARFPTTGGRAVPVRGGTTWSSPTAPPPCGRPKPGLATVSAPSCTPSPMGPLARVRCRQPHRRGPGLGVPTRAHAARPRAAARPRSGEPGAARPPYSVFAPVSARTPRPARRSRGSPSTPDDSGPDQPEHRHGALADRHRRGGVRKNGSISARALTAIRCQPVLVSVRRVIRREARPPPHGPS